MSRIALVTLVVSLVANVSTPHAVAALLPPVPPPVTKATQPKKAKNLYFAYKVKITNGVPG